MNKVIRFLPLVLVIALGVVLYRGLSLNPQDMPSALVGNAMPEFSLSTLNDENKMVTKADLAGDIVLLNVWATWCPTCKYEHPYLLELATDPQLNSQVTLYGVNYKDERPAAQEWLTHYKDPYQFSIFDEEAISVENSQGKQNYFIENPENIQLYHVGNMHKQLVNNIAHPSNGATALHTSWVMDEILK